MRVRVGHVRNRKFLTRTRAASAGINFAASFVDEGGLHFDRVATSTNFFQCGESKIVAGIPLVANS